MMHRAWSSIEEVPYCFSRSYVKLQGHKALKIIDFDPNWSFPDYRRVAAFKSLRFALLCSKFSSPWLGEAYIHHQTMLSLVQMIACRLFGAKPLSEPILMNRWLAHWEQILVKFELKCNNFHTRDLIWKCHVQIGGHFVSSQVLNHCPPVIEHRINERD